MKIKDIAHYVTEKIPVVQISTSTYIGMDNMIPNRGGVVPSEYLPEDGYAISFRKGDVLLGNIRPYFKKIWLATFDGGCSHDVLCLRSNGDVSPEFLYCCLAQDSFFDYDVKGAKGSKMPRGDKDHILEFPIVDIKDKNRAGKFVDTITKKIETNNTLSSKLESLARMIYNYWFLQFDFPDENGRPYRSSGGKMAWSAELKRDIPEGWEAIRLGDLMKISRGVSYTGGDLGKSGTPIISLASIDRNGCYIPDGIKYYTKDYPRTKVLKPYDLVMANTDMTQERAVMGKIIFVPDIFEGDILSTHHITQVHVPNYFKAYLMMTTQTEWFHNYIKGFASGTNVLGLDMIGFESFIIQKPNKNLLEKFNRLMLNLYGKISDIYKENERLASLRDFLLPLLMNGQVTFKDKTV